MFSMPNFHGFSGVSWSAPSAFSSRIVVTNGTQTYVTMPSTISAGDFIVVQRTIYSMGSTPANTFNSEFTLISTNTHSYSTSAGTNYVRDQLAYKIANGTEDAQNLGGWVGGGAMGGSSIAAVLKPTNGTFGNPKTIWGHSRLLDGATLPFASVTGEKYLAVAIGGVYGTSGDYSQITGLTADDSNTSLSSYATTKIYSGQLPITNKTYDYVTTLSDTECSGCVIFSW